LGSYITEGIGLSRDETEKKHVFLLPRKYSSTPSHPTKLGTSVQIVVVFGDIIEDREEYTATR
jgi:hypothetical protein